jgi:IclR family KDG regulon transcriptional repressor
MPESRQGGAPVSAALRTLAVLERLSEKRSVSLEDLSRDLGLAAPTVYRFLLTLQGQGYVRRDHDEGWTLTLKMFNVGSRSLDRLDLVESARHPAAALAEDLGETVHMGVLDGGSAVYVIKIESRYTIRMHSRVGRRVPLHCTAIGKTLLAWSPAAELEALLATMPLTAMTPATIVDKNALRAELGAIRERGFAFDREEHEEGIRCIAAPVFNHEGGIVAAISTSWPGFRYVLVDEAKAAARVAATAREVSSILGAM